MEHSTENDILIQFSNHVEFSKRMKTALRISTSKYWTNKWVHEQMSKWANEQMNKWTNEQMKMNKWMNKLTNIQMTMNKWTND